MRLQLDHGLRAGEIAGLRVEHISLVDGTLRFTAPRSTGSRRRCSSPIRCVPRLQEAGGWKSSAMPLRYVERAAVANAGVTLAD